MDVRKKGIVELTRLLAEGYDPNYRNMAGEPMIAVAAKWSGMWSNPQAVILLLSFGAHVDARDNHGNTALMETILYSNTMADIRVATILLDHGADINARNSYGFTALERLTKYWSGEYSKVQFDILIDAGACNCEPLLNNEANKYLTRGRYDCTRNRCRRRLINYWYNKRLLWRRRYYWS